MSKVAVFFAEGFEEIEALTVVDLLRRAQIETEIVRVPQKGAAQECCGHRVTGSHGISVRADRMLADVDFDTLDMIVLPGGMPGTANLRANDELMAHVTEFHQQERFIAAICAAPTILGVCGILQGRKAVCYPSPENEAMLVGAQVVPVECVRDGHIITSRGVGTAISFSLAIIEALAGKEQADKIAKSIIYRAYD